MLQIQQFARGDSSTACQGQVQCSIHPWLVRAPSIRLVTPLRYQHGILVNICTLKHVHLTDKDSCSMNE